MKDLLITSFKLYNRIIITLKSKVFSSLTFIEPAACLCRDASVLVALLAVNFVVVLPFLDRVQVRAVLAPEAHHGLHTASLVVKGVQRSEDGRLQDLMHSAVHFTQRLFSSLIFIRRGEEVDF